MWGRRNVMSKNNYRLLPEHKLDIENPSISTSPTPFAIETRLSDEVIDRLNEYISIAKTNNNDVRETLAGNISSSLDLID